jgi:hypothetical protein
MPKRDVVGQKKKERTIQNQRVSKVNFQPISKDPMASDISSFLIDPTPFNAPIQRHTTLLSGASPEQRAIIARRLQQTYGNKYVQRLVESMGAQSKSTTSSPSNVYEREVTRVSDTITMAIQTPINRKEDEEEPVQMKASLFQRQGTSKEKEQMLPVPHEVTSEEKEVLQGNASLLPQSNTSSKSLSVQLESIGKDDTIQRNGDGETVTADQLTMRKVTSGSLEGGKKVSDYYPDIVGTKSWGSDTAAGPFDNGTRAGSVVQLIGEIPAETDQADYTLKQTITVSTMKLNGESHALEGQTLDDVARSGRDQSTTPFRQTWDNKVTMCDPISGVPYNKLKTYDFEANATTSIEHKDGASKSVNWGVKLKAKDGKVTENTVD